METTPEAPAAAPTWTPALSAAAPVGPATLVGDAELQRLAETFAATPEAVRLAVERVGPDFRDLQRELGGRR